MGVERSVTLWYLRRQLILEEIAQLEAKRALVPVEVNTVEPGETPLLDTAKVDLETVDVKLVDARNRLKGLGHCPKPMMG